MVKLVGNDTMEEIEAYFDYENNFPQLLEDYIKKSGEVEELFQKSKDNNRSHFNRVMKYQLKKLNEQTTDEDPPRIKLFKTWMSNLYEQKKMRYHKKDSELEKDKLIIELSETIIQLKHEVRSLNNENQHYRHKINKLRKQLKAPKPEPPPEPEPEPSPELLNMMDPDYDSDDDIVEKPPPAPRPKEEPKLDSIYSNHLTQEEEKEKDDYEQQIKAECERKAREREEDIEKKEKIEKIMETYYSQCDIEIDKMLKKFNKEVKKADRTKKSIKNDYTDSLEDILNEIQEEYLENHDELEEVSKERKLRMITRPLELFESRLPSEMVQVQIESGN